MKLLFKERFFSWLDSYDVFDEDGTVCYRVEGKLAWGHCLEIHDAGGRLLGSVREQVISFLPRFRILLGEEPIGEIRKEFTLLKPRFQLDFNGWQVQGDFFEWNYEVTNGSELIMRASKRFWNWTDTYEIDVVKPENALYSLMIVLAIDAAKCSADS